MPEIPAGTVGKDQIADTPVTAGPPVIEGPGRYVVYGAADGGWVIARALGICDRCKSCGCGEQEEPVMIPGMVVSLAKSQGKGKLLGALRAARRG